MLAVILFVALNVYGSLALRGLRLDLTQNRQFTLSSGTEQLLAKLDEPITLRFYASRALRDANPFLGSYADRVHDLLRSYAEASNGKIAVEYHRSRAVLARGGPGGRVRSGAAVARGRLERRLSRHRRHQQHRRRRRPADAFARSASPSSSTT